MTSRITILGGHGRNGYPEPVERVDLDVGDLVAVVGPTGSGKTTLINDLELLADGSTPSGRRVLIDGKEPDPDLRLAPSSNPVALITQHTTFLSDLPVDDFLRAHARIRTRRNERDEDTVARTLDLANELTGEPIRPRLRMTELSGGQTRALLIADAAIVCDTPIVLVDELENAGIDRGRAMERLRNHDKIFVFVTHDPRIALMSDFRIVLKEGAMVDVLRAHEAEQDAFRRVKHLDEEMSRFRNAIRAGSRVSALPLEVAP